MVNSENLELTCHEKVNDDVVFYCQDLSSGILTSSFSITIKDTDFSWLLPDLIRKSIKILNMNNRISAIKNDVQDRTALPGRNYVTMSVKLHQTS